MPYTPKQPKKPAGRPERPIRQDGEAPGVSRPQADPPEGYHRPEHAKPDKPSDPWEGGLCKVCFPDGWPEGNYAGGCGHGYFERKAV